MENNQIENFIQRESIVKEVDLLIEILDLMFMRGTIDGKTYKGLETYRDELYSMLVKYDKGQLKAAGK